MFRILGLILVIICLSARLDVADGLKSKPRPEFREPSVVKVVSNDEPAKGSLPPPPKPSAEFDLDSLLNDLLSSYQAKPVDDKAGGAAADPKVATTEQGTSQGTNQGTNQGTSQAPAGDGNLAGEDKKKTIDWKKLLDDTLAELKARRERQNSNVGNKNSGKGWLDNDDFWNFFSDSDLEL